MVKRIEYSTQTLRVILEEDVIKKLLVLPADMQLTAVTVFRAAKGKPDAPLSPLGATTTTVEFELVRQLSVG